MNLKAGMKVILSSNLTASIVEYGGSTAKRRMQGTTQKIHRVFNRSITVKTESPGSEWTILKSDISGYADAPNIKKIKIELFDPSNLDIG